MNQTYVELISRIFELFDTGEEAIQFLNAKGLDGGQFLLPDLEALCTSIASAIEKLSPQISLKNKLREIGLNAPPTVARICQSVGAGEIESAEMQYRCSFVPLFRFWRRYAAFFLVHAADEASLRSWYREEWKQFRQIRKTPKQDENREYRYDFSIVVLFYGNQKMTKDCLDAIETHTRGHSYELITFDNGSDPETTAWCESLPHVKKIYYPYNMGSSAAGNMIFTMASSYMEGKYLLYVSNDVIVTPRYADILYQCMESDARIAMAVPLCNSASNLQAISVPYAPNDMEAMQEFAEDFNQCNPQKWADRARLFAILASMRPQALEQMQLAIDPFFCYDMFADDDFCCALRRMGYRQVLCNDVFVHHYGSATIKEGQFQVMDLGREQFYQKYGVDAWNSLGTELCAAINTILFHQPGSLRVLAINPLFGESVLALCNRLRVCECDGITVDALTEDDRYLDDMEALFQRSGLLQAEKQAAEGQYDIVLVGTDLERCRDLRAVIHTAAQYLGPDGIFITQHKNRTNFLTLYNLLQGDAMENDIFAHDLQENPGIVSISDSALELLMSQSGLKQKQAIRVTNSSWKPNIEQILNVFNIKNREKAEQLLLTSDTFSIWEKGC